MELLLLYHLVPFEIAIVALCVLYVGGHMAWKAYQKYLDFQRSRIPQKIKKVTPPAATASSKKKLAPAEEIMTEKKPKKLTATQREELDNIIKKAQAKNSIQEYEEARALVIQGLIIDKHNEELNCLLARDYERIGDYKKAELIYKDLILEKEPKDAQLYIYLGHTLLEQNNQKLAIEVFKKGLEKEKNNTEILKVLSELCYQMKMFEDAMIYAADLASKKPRDLDNLTVLAQSYWQIGDLQKAYESLLKLRNFDPYNQKVQQWVAKLESDLGIS